MHWHDASDMDTQGPKLNYQTYPIPANAMLAAAAERTGKIEARQQDYMDKDHYMNGGKYSSAKTISHVRELYISQDMIIWGYYRNRLLLRW